MSLYAKYLKEREDVDTLETEYGFATYRLRGDDCYIMDIYVVPELRRAGLAAALADDVAKIAKALGYRVLTGSVDSRANGAEDSHKVLTAYGMKPYLKDEYMTYYSKEIT